MHLPDSKTCPRGRQADGLTASSSSLVIGKMWSWGFGKISQTRWQWLSGNCRLLCNSATAVQMQRQQKVASKQLLPFDLAEQYSISYIVCFLLTALSDHLWLPTMRPRCGQWHSQKRRGWHVRGVWRGREWWGIWRSSKSAITRRSWWRRASTTMWWWYREKCHSALPDALFPSPDRRDRRRYHGHHEQTEVW